MNALELLSAALTNLECLEHHLPNRDRSIYLMAVEQIEQARVTLSPYPPSEAAPYRPRASFQPLMDD